MDVGNPSNLARMRVLYNDDLVRLKEDVAAVSTGDKKTLEEIKRTYEKTGRILDPHTAVGVAAARRARSEMSEDASDFIVLATAQPAKFAEIIEPLIRVKVPVPKRLQDVLGRKKESVTIAAEYRSLLRILS
jgi:threonine synthase